MLLTSDEARRLVLSLAANAAVTLAVCVCFWRGGIEEGGGGEDGGDVDVAVLEQVDLVGAAYDDEREISMW